MVQIGFVGVGRMGLPMCANLVRAGHTVLASDIRAERADAVRACGARWSPSAVRVAATSDMLITMLPGPPEVTEAMLGTAGLADAMPTAATWIDMTSNSPAVAEKVRHRLQARGVGVLEAPVGGGIRAAEAGLLQLFVGGDVALFERHRELLTAMADAARIAHVGGHGAGYTTKLLVNLLWFGQAVATAEALLLGQSLGIDLGVLRGALATSAAGSEFVRRDLGALFAGDYLESFGLDRCCEELEAVTELARQRGVPSALSDLVSSTYRRALARFGAIDGELLAVALLEEEAGHLLRHP